MSDNVAELDRPSLVRILIHDALLSCVGGMSLVAVYSLKDVAWYWPFVVIFGVAGFFDLVGRLFPSISAAGAAWFKAHVVGIYERAEGDRAFHLHYKRKNTREGIIYYGLFCGSTAVGVVPFVAASVVAARTNAWAHENPYMFAFIATVSLMVLMVLTLRLVAFAAVRLEQRIAARSMR